MGKMDIRNPVFKVGIVGSGSMAEAHIRAICRIKGLQLFGIYSHNRQRAQYLSKKYSNLKVVDDYDYLVESCDVLDIVTKNHTHLDYAEKPIACNKHLVIEKPVDIDVEKAMQFLSKIRNSSSKVTVISQNWFNENIQRFMRDKNDAKLGDIFHVRLTLMWRRDQDYYRANQGWRSRLKEAGGGVVLHQGIHLIDLLIRMFGDVEKVFSFTKKLQNEIEVEDLAVASMLMSNGILVNLSFSTCASCNFPFVIEVFGTKATAIIYGNNGYKLLSDDRCVRPSFLQKLFYKTGFKFEFSFSRRLREGTILDQLQQFYDDIVYGQNKTANFSDAVKALVGAYQIISKYESREAGKETIARSHE